MTTADRVYGHGLANCDTCRKARKWLERFGVAHAFVDYRDQPQSPETLVDWAAAARRLGRDGQQVVDDLAQLPPHRKAPGSRRGVEAAAARSTRS